MLPFFSSFLSLSSTYLSIIVFLPFFPYSSPSTLDLFLFSPLPFFLFQFSICFSFLLSFLSFLLFLVSLPFFPYSSFSVSLSFSSFLSLSSLPTFLLIIFPQFHALPFPLSFCFFSPVSLFFPIYFPFVALFSSYSLSTLPLYLFSPDSSLSNLSSYPFPSPPDSYLHNLLLLSIPPTKPTHYFCA